MATEDSVKSDPVRDLIWAARILLATNPVFRSKPLGSEGSIARQHQRDCIEAEDALRAAIAKCESA